MRYHQLLRHERISTDYRRVLSEVENDARAMRDLALAYPQHASQLEHEAAEMVKNCRTYWTGKQEKENDTYYENIQEV